MYHSLLKPNRICRLVRNFRTKYGRDPLSRPSIRAWHKKFMETRTVFDKGRSGRPRTSEEKCKKSCTGKGILSEATKLKYIRLIL